MNDMPTVPVLDTEQQQRLVELSARSATLISTSFARHLEELFGDDFQMINTRDVAASFQEFGLKLLSDPVRLATAQASLVSDTMALWQRFFESATGGELRPLIEPSRGDRRFKDPAWSENPAYAYIEQGYLVFANWLQKLVDDAQDLDPKVHQRVRFFTRQYLSALAPSNNPFTNPEVLRRAQETGGKSLLDGLEHFLDDLERGGGHLQISMSDDSTFALGKNLALTPGKVIYKNDLIELIQYAPSTPTVHKRPFLFIPAWINKFYIMDLQPKNSFIRWLVGQGHTVFLMSWVNPTKALAHKRFEDYLSEGPLAAMDIIEQQTGEREVNLAGYCIGGILLATGLAYLAAKGDDRVKSATFFVTLFDFSEDVGELGIFVDAGQLESMEAHTRETGFLEGRHLATTFAMLRENDLIWSFVVNNYLLGRDPAPFDLLYWNADQTTLPAQMLSDYARAFYLQNALERPNTFEVFGTPVDTRKITTPSYTVATREDHLAPWRSCYPVTQQFAGPVRFCLAGSGHIAGVMNPAGSLKYGYWVNENEPPAEPEAWFAGAEHREGSWWLDWAEWLAQYGGEMVEARDPSAGPLKPLGDAPGEYVKMRADQKT